ncbi:MAG: FAD:protein FMN transferase, partial [Cellulomonadaceae bacterium]|nr:FAD:protein FMN transferase [Cellulomonadaceae bacterium]
DAEEHLDRAETVIRAVAQHCTRFDPTSALSLANAAPDAWHVVPRVLADAVAEAARAHRETEGLFDPRVLGVLVGWGYDRSLPFADGDLSVPVPVPAPASASSASSSATAWQAAVASGITRPSAPLTNPWRPQVVTDGGVHLIHLDGWAVDLGGIGKGLAVRWAAAELAGAGAGHLVDAGGDQHLAGAGPDGDAWVVGVEDPLGGHEPVLVLAVTDTGCTTSSTRLRRWTSGGSRVHHLVDPRTGQPGGEGLAAVTVVAPDPAWAEVWSKTLFLAGAAGVRAQAEVHGLAAAWVRQDGTVGTSSAMDPLVIWRSSRA